MSMSVAPEQMSAAADYVAEHYGSSGYRFVGIESPTAHVSVFHVRASDGAEFMVCADRYGNARAVPESIGWRAVVESMSHAPDLSTWAGVLD